MASARPGHYNWCQGDKPAGNVRPNASKINCYKVPPLEPLKMASTFALPSLILGFRLIEMNPERVHRALTGEWLVWFLVP